MADAPDEVPSAPTVPCPACGVPVALGYPRCPKCHAAVPQGPRAHRGSVREELLAGGTSLETEGGGTPWLPWVIAAVVIVGIGGFLAFRAGGSKSTGTSAKVEDTNEDVDDTDEDEDDEEEEVAPRSGGPQPVAKPKDTMPAAVKLLDDTLRGERLWAKVRRDDSSLEIESKLCAAIESEIAGVAADLRALGATSVSCISVNGELRFETSL